MRKTDKLETAKPVTAQADIADKIRISSKVIVPNERQPGNKMRDRLPKMTDIDALVNKIATRNNDNLGMMELLPDLRLAKRILVPSILSPKDLVQVKLSLSTENTDIEGELPQDLLVDITNHFRTTFNLESRLSTILDEALFDHGSYVMAVLPESTLETVIQSGRITGMESYDDFMSSHRKEFAPLGILSSKTVDNDYFSITDNINVLKVRKLRQMALEASIGSMVGMEMYRRAPVVTIPPGQGASSSKERNPLVMKLPNEAVIPVHVPGEPSDHLGYYLVVDSNGLPVSKTKTGSHLDLLRKQVQESSQNDALGGLIQITKFNVGDRDAIAANPDIFINQYVDYIENELAQQLKKGKYGPEVEVSRPTDTYMVMLSRALSKKKTQLVYLPKELVSYTAFNYDEYGIGVSLLEITKVFGSLRAVLMFADVMAGVKNSVGHTRLDVTLDEDDPDPQATLEAAIQQFAGLQTDKLPLATLNAGDIVKSLQRASVDVNVEGGEAFPNTRTSIEDVSRDRRRPDDTLSEMLRRMQYSGLGIPPEIVDSTMEGELATVVVSRNLMYAKQVMEYQRQFCWHLTQFVRTYIKCSGELLKLINEGLKEAKIDETLMLDYINSIEVTLPQPDLAKVRNQAEAYREYSDAIDIAVSAYITEDMMSDLMEGDVDSRALESLRISVASHFKRDWMRRQNIFYEISEAFDEEDGALSDRINDHNKQVIKALGDVMAKLMKEEDKVRTKLDKINEPEPEPEAEADAGDDEFAGDDAGDGEGDEEAPADNAGGEEGAPDEGGEEDGFSGFNF